MVFGSKSTNNIPDNKNRVFIATLYQNITVLLYLLRESNVFELHFVLSLFSRLD